MNPARKAVRQYLRNATRTEYECMIREAKLTPLETEIVNLSVLDGLAHYQIAARVNVSERTVRRCVTRVYERLAAARPIHGRSTDV